MRAGKQLITNVPLDGDTAANQVTRVLSSAGYQVVQSFDFNPVAEQNHIAHRMTVFLVYPSQGSPATLWIDSDPTPQSMISLSNEPSEWQELLRQILTDCFLSDNAKPLGNNPTP